jgi:hypothetical protein
MPLGRAPSATRIVFAFLSALFWLGCQKAVQPVSAGKAPKSPSPAGPTLPQNTNQTLGPGDGGGGNGYDNKLYESDIIDPTQLPAHSEKLAPVVDRLNTLFASEKASEPLFWSIMFRYKTWYLVAKEFKSLPKETLGVHFLSGESQQIAFQTDREVWISSLSFNKMTKVAQAELLMHELVMSIYLLKYEKFSDLCKIQNRIMGQNKKCDVDLDTYLPPQDKAPLNKEDYANIRAATHYLLHLPSSTTKLEVASTLLASGFDSRIFGSLLSDPRSEKGNELHLTRDELMTIFQEAKLMNQLSSQCSLGALNLTRPCQATFEESSVKITDPYELKSIRLRLSLQGTTIVDEELMPETMVFTNLNLPGTREKHYIGIAAGGARSQNLQIGDRFATTIVFLTEREHFGKPLLRFAGIATVPGILTRKQPATASEPTQCIALRPKATDATNDALLMLMPELDVAFTRWLINQIPVVPLCLSESLPTVPAPSATH